ncbi:MAG: hypothetical protein OEM66_03930, partial [Acidimicrobiia bacterium]|nr:hypothetical protein [Acidimicrobiia bacterium]
VQRAIELCPSLQGLWLSQDLALWWVGRAAKNAGLYETAREFFERSGVVARETGSRYMQTVSAMSTSLTYRLTGRLEEAAAVLGESLPLARSLLGTNPATPQFLLHAAGVARLQGDQRLARTYLDEAQSWCTREDQAWLRDMLTHQEALIARDDGDPEEALVLLSGLEDDDDFRLSQAGVQLRLGKPDVALELLQEAIAKADRLRHHHAVQATDTAAIAFSSLDKPRLAARLMGAVDAERETTGLVVPPPDRELRQAAVSHAQAILGEEWEREVKAGRSLSLDEAIGLARAEISTLQGGISSSPAAVFGSR